MIQMHIPFFEKHCFRSQNNEVMLWLAKEEKNQKLSKTIQSMKQEHIWNQQINYATWRNFYEFCNYVIHQLLYKARKQNENEF